MKDNRCKKAADDAFSLEASDNPGPQLIVSAFSADWGSGHYDGGPQKFFTLPDQQEELEEFIKFVETYGYCNVVAVKNNNHEKNN